MSKQPPVHINVDLPELTPAQARFLWKFLDDLAADLWNAYEPQMLDEDDQPKPTSEEDTEMTAEDWLDIFEQRQAPSVKKASDPNRDF